MASCYSDHWPDVVCSASAASRRLSVQEKCDAVGERWPRIRRGGRKLFGFINVRGQKGPLHNKLRLETGLTFLSVVALSNLKGVEKNGNCPDN